MNDRVIKSVMVRIPVYSPNGELLCRIPQLAVDDLDKCWPIVQECPVRPGMIIRIEK